MYSLSVLEAWEQQGIPSETYYIQPTQNISQASGITSDALWFPVWHLSDVYVQAAQIDMEKGMDNVI